MLHYFYNFYSN